ncbi:hypothetical protein A2U01_0009720 [Trifolium medium]|uniref:Uncharacterized protein n=1 Tax=Trifolium medium TaxID=97028 RepID=A0A392MMU9_9FABA|nr:hypothetical protein [Trifolium medium]
MEEKDRKFYSNPSHAKNFGQYSPPVPADLLEKLAAMKVQQQTDPQPNQSSNQHNTSFPHPQQNSHNTMESMQSTQEERIKRAHRLSYNQELQLMDTATDTTKQDQMVQIKRQKMEEKSRVGTARQASPRQ